MCMFYRFSSKKPNLNNKVVRIKIPSKIHEKIRSKFVIIKINNGSEFLEKISDEKRFVISKEQKIKFLNKNVIIIKEIKIKKKLEKNLIKNKKINLIKLIAEKTRCGTQINIIEKDDNLICFCKSFNGRLRNIIIKKRAPLKFCRLLGYYQAEGSKEKKIKKRKGRQVVITNTDFNLIEDFINLSKHIIETSIWNAEIKLPKKNKQKENFIKKKLIKLGISKKKIKTRIENKLKDFSIRLFICSTLLSDIVINLMNKIREKLIKEDLSNKDFLEMYINFMQGLFAGDGNYDTYKNKMGGTHHRLIFYEADKDYANDYQKLLEKIGIESRLIKIKNKNLYIIRSTLNWKYLLLFQELKIFKYHGKHRISLINSIKNHKRYRSHKSLRYIDSGFNISKICKISNKDKTTCYNWIKEMTSKGIVIKNRINDWSLSQEGKRIKKILGGLDKLPCDNQAV